MLCIQVVALHGGMVLVGLKPISVVIWLPSVLDTVGWVIWPIKIFSAMAYKVDR